jgi:hypothetical protein
MLPKHRFITSTHSVTCFGRSFQKLDSSDHGMDPNETILCCKRVMSTREPVNSAVPIPVKSTGVQMILVLPQTEKSWKIWLTEYSIWVSACMHEMQRGTRLACMLVWAGQLSQRSCWQPNMPEWRRDAGPSGPSAGHKPPCFSNGHHVCSSKPKVHQKSPTSHRRYW